MRHRQEFKHIHPLVLLSLQLIVGALMLALMAAAAMGLLDFAGWIGDTHGISARYGLWMPLQAWFGPDQPAMYRAIDGVKTIGGWVLEVGTVSMVVLVASYACSGVRHLVQDMRRKNVVAAATPAVIPAAPAKPATLQQLPQQVSFRPAASLSVQPAPATETVRQPQPLVA